MLKTDKSLCCVAFASFPETQPSTAVSTEAALTKENTDGLRYWLYTPRDAAENMPLILYLHNSNGKGDDLDILMAEDGFPKYVAEGTLGELPAYIVMPQLPKEEKAWADLKEPIKALISHMTGAYGIDSARISITGHSMGGTGTFAIAAAYPELFCCAVPMSGRVPDRQKALQALSAMPVWAFVGTADTVTPPKLSRDFIVSLQERNQKAQITAIEGAEHAQVPGKAFLEPAFDLVGWMLAQHK